MFALQCLNTKVKADTHANLVAGWLLTIGGIIGVVLPVLPGWPFLLVGVSILSNHYGWARRVMAWLHLNFSSIKRHLERLKKERRTSMLQLATQHSHEVITIWCKGRIVLGGDLHRLRVATLSQSTPEVMLDLSSVNLIDAAGLGALVDLHKRFQCAGKKMGLMDPTRFVSQVLELHVWTQCFTSYVLGRKETAVASSDSPDRRRPSDADPHQPLGPARHRRGSSHVRALAAGEFLQVSAGGVSDRCAGGLSGRARRSHPFGPQPGTESRRERAANGSYPSEKTQGTLWGNGHRLYRWRHSLPGRLRNCRREKPNGD